VAILDGGIRDTHIDIAPNLDATHSISFVPNAAFNSDSAKPPNGKCGDAIDTFWHGTHVAGIVAAAANNLGTVGIAPKATIIGVKVLHCGSGNFGAIISGIVYAATPIAEGGAGANVINMSLGVPGGIPKNARVQSLLNAVSRATSYAKKRDVVVVAAAGNDGIDIDHTDNLTFIPAQSVDVISVAATAPSGWATSSPLEGVDSPATYTNFGQSAISFAAPGGDTKLLATNPGGVCVKPRFPAGSVIQLCWVLDMVMAPCRGSGASNGTYCWAAGTSMAAPAVSGVAALIVGKYGPIGAAQVEAILRQSADDLGKPGQDDFYGKGRVNAFRAVQ
ncbi:MAG: peptidase S8 and S53 subtilisin kexin sedolisin, partial [Betaproteobacteria bacterium]